MQNLCIRCALRVRIAESRSQQPAKRAFSATAQARRGPLPKFTETSQSELDDVLASLRYKHLLPAALSNAERNLIYKPKNKQQLIDYPVKATVGDEEIELFYIDRLADVPSLHKYIIPQVVKLMSKGKPSDWDQLPAMLAGLKRAKMTPRYEVMGKIARKAIEAGRLDIIMRCIQQASINDVTLKKPEVLHNVLYGLRRVAQKDGWSEEATRKAIRDASEIAQRLEDEEHGSGTAIKPGDPRTRPAVLGIFLDLSAIYAYKHQDGKDLDGKVRAYAERLLSNIESNKKREEAASLPSEQSSDPAESIKINAGIKPRSTTTRSDGPQNEILKGVPLWHGLRLAQKILGNDMPYPMLAREVISDWGDGLEKLTEGLIKTKVKDDRTVVKNEPKKRTYDRQALDVWRSCIEIAE